MRVCGYGWVEAACGCSKIGTTAVLESHALVPEMLVFGCDREDRVGGTRGWLAWPRPQCGGSEAEAVTGDTNEPADVVTSSRAGSSGGAGPASPGPQTLPPRQQAADGSPKHLSHQSRNAITFGYLVVAMAALILLRATVNRLDFIGIGWLIALVLIPLLPWALPRLGAFIQTMSRYVSRVGIGALQLDLRAVTDAAIVVPTSGANVLAGLPNDQAALSTGTGITEVIASLRTLRIQGGAPGGIIDLQTGTKWRLPNLYYLSVVLEVDPVVAMLFFTETRRGIDGYFVRMSRPGEFRRQIEQAVPAYGAARAAVELPQRGDLSNMNTSQQLANTFSQFKGNLPPNSGTDNDPVFGFVSAECLNELVISPAGPVVESAGDALSGEPLRTVLTAADRYVPTTTAGRLSGLIDRDAVALAVARAALART